MAGYIGKSQGVTQVDGYTRSEADAEHTGTQTFNRTSTDGDIVTLKKDGTTIGTIGTYSGYPYIANNLSDGVAVFNNHFAPSTETGAVNDGTMDLGSSTRRFKNLYLSGGVYLGGTGSANYLDDYEEGTWTPAIYGTGGTSGVTYGSSNAGFYTKVGNVVHTSAKLHVSDKGTLTSSVGISGFPFAISNSEAKRGGAAFGYTSTIAPEDIGFMLTAGQTSGILRILNSGDFTTSQLSTSFSLWFTYTYII